MLRVPFACNLYAMCYMICHMQTTIPKPSQKPKPKAKAKSQKPKAKSQKQIKDFSSKMQQKACKSEILAPKCSKRHCRGAAKNLDLQTSGSTSHLDKLGSLALHGCSHGIKQSLRLHVAAGRGEWLRVQCQGIVASNGCSEQEPCSEYQT